MSKPLKKALSYIIPLALGFGLLYYVFNEIDVNQTLAEFKKANYFWVFIAGVLALLSHIVRAARWNLMLGAMDLKPSLYHSTLAVLIGYITNLIFPRAGEVARSVSLQKSEDIPFDKSFGAVIAERLVDVLVLLILVVLNLSLEYERIFALFHELFPDFEFTWMLPVIVVLGIIGFIAAFKYSDLLFTLPILNKLKKFVDGLKEGFASVANLKKPGLFIFQSFLLWGLYYVSSLVLCKSIDLGVMLSPLAILTILVMGTIGMAIPTMGGIGSYHLLVGKIVTLYGLNAQDGVTLATFLHTINGIFFVILFGLVSLVLSSMSKK